MTDSVLRIFSDIIWETVTTDVPSIEMQIAEILSKAFP
jgi:hypothetical protein